MKSNNSPYEQQRVKTSFSPPIKIGKTKHVGKNSFGENIGGGEKWKDTNQTQKLSWGYTWRKIFPHSINANLTLCDP